MNDNQDYRQNVKTPRVFKFATMIVFGVKITANAWTYRYDLK